MTRIKTSALIAVMTTVVALPASAQLGRQQGLIEPNVAADTTLAKLPLGEHGAHLITTNKPILSPVALDSLLGAAGLTRAQRTDLYRKLFVHVDVNRGTDAEFLLIPGVDANKLNAIKAGRPWATFEQFQAAMGKTMKPDEVARIEQYLFIPIELNTWTDPIMDSFAGIGVGTRRWKREFAEYRPWTSMEQFRREIGKYVRGNPTEVTRLERYVIIK